ncbi:hypothetical protein DL766_000602 [Monosporascus sp. MC13-8B]|uniref:Actin-like ATPase domain-containing protein n=1 Tax=Monosporascus cannonballus TaxID=155416 RepID=A0ABY0HIP8_9PEZI|nr:hypothetical protein DL762_000649 [Monosporascus cannonballus]RYP39060.1 hypothetical protein DL766_000602 [Monosporascus sp. MC13-8B]
MTSSRSEIIVGVDYGTTYTGVSYVTTNNTRDQIAVLQNWPHIAGQSKTPTVISYKSENPHDRRGPEVRWGADVKDTMTSCSWTKLLLDTSAETQEYNDPSLQNAAGSILFHRPAGKSAQQVCQDFLTQVYRHVMQALKAHYPAHLDITPVQFYFTMPAIWTDRAQAATKAAARGAGFGSRSLDKIHMITEPEAAAIAALKEELSPGSPNAAKVGDNILVLDCGGGTVDITTYSIKKTQPIIAFDEICEGSGGKCGSTYIDREFRKLLARRFGRAFEIEPEVFKSPKSRLMQEFEKAKRIFGSTDGDCFEISGINLRGEFSEEHYDSSEGAVLLSKKDMEDLFAPVLKDILRLLSDQYEKALRKGKRIGLIILVGGFGSSDYLKQAVDSWCTQKSGIKCIRPAHCQAAIVRGAAIRGLEGTVPDKLICRRHYGFSWGLPFRAGIDEERYSYMSFGSKFCSGHMNWMIAKGTEITKSTSKTVDVYRTWSPGQSYVFHDTLYSSTLDNAPARQEHPRVDTIGSITMDFTGVDMSRFQKRNTSSGIEYNLQYQFKIDFRTDEGVLRYSCVSNGKTIGATTISFTE